MWRSSKVKDALYAFMNSDKPLIVFDTETTGFSTVKNNVIQISAIELNVNEEKKFIEKSRLDKYINPGYSIPPKITEITGISDETVIDEPYEEEIFNDYIYPFFGDSPVVAGYNAGFDVRFLTTMYERYGKTFSPITLDVLEMVKDVVEATDTNDRKLGTIANYYGVDKDLTFHNSMDDVIATYRILTIMYHEYKEKDDEEAMKKATTIKRVAKISSMRYWPGYRGYARIYINTNLGQFFYDIRKQTWDKSNTNLIDIDSVDMEQLRVDAFLLANATSEKEFARYRES